MILMIRIAILIALVKVLIETNKPLLCAGIYASFVIFMCVLLEIPFANVLFYGAVTLAGAWLYFWLLDRFEGSGGLWYVILIGGVLIGMV